MRKYIQILFEVSRKIYRRFRSVFSGPAIGKRSSRYYNHPYFNHLTKNMKKTLLTLIMLGYCITPILTFAQKSNDFEIIPEATSQTKVDTAVESV
jgi:hypothetical protein